jgi:hypothetical protein
MNHAVVRFRGAAAPPWRAIAPNGNNVKSATQNNLQNM